MFWLTSKDEHDNSSLLGIISSLDYKLQQDYKFSFYKNAINIVPVI